MRSSKWKIPRGIPGRLIGTGYQSLWTRQLLHTVQYHRLVAITSSVTSVLEFVSKISKIMIISLLLLLTVICLETLNVSSVNTTD